MQGIQDCRMMTLKGNIYCTLSSNDSGITVKEEVEIV